jgi:sec-independent protein translocase protein TatB
MFDVGFSELLLLSLVGLLVLGPERLPKVARTLGGLARKARSSWLSLKRSIEAEMRADELREPLRNFQKEMRNTVDSVKSAAADTVGTASSSEPDTAPAERPPESPSGDS